MARIVSALRSLPRAPLPEDELRQIVPWIPPRVVTRLHVASARGGDVPGVYIETFITPEELRVHAFRRAIEKVNDAVRCAAREGCRIASLGGFTSIVLEGRTEVPAGCERLSLTTGNTLTVALIGQGIAGASRHLGMALSDATLLVVGSTGDIGSGCAAWLGSRVRRLLLAARHPDRLRRQEASLRRAGVKARASRDVEALLSEADIVVCAASMSEPQLDLLRLRPGALVCDAGYPKNVRGTSQGPGGPRIFWGGMGRLAEGWKAESGVLDAVYGFPVPWVAHGCLLEGMVLALARRYEPFSQGRGRITPERVDEIWALAREQGVEVAPFFGPDGLWPGQGLAAPGPGGATCSGFA
jgi:fatty aldehyde-generating acyl-ACP reductase